MLFDFHNQKKKIKNSLALGIEHQNEKSQYLFKFPDVNQLTDLEAIDWKGEASCPEEGP